VIAQRFVPHIRARGEDTGNQLRDPECKPRRWVVEACHSWLNRNRALLIRWSKKDENHLALLQLGQRPDRAQGGPRRRADTRLLR